MRTDGRICRYWQGFELPELDYTSCTACDAVRVPAQSERCPAAGHSQGPPGLLVEEVHVGTVLPEQKTLEGVQAVLDAAERAEGAEVVDAERQ
ncbi:hypothetical protein OG765_05665 [Streptomyces sp. NBC_00555]|uniref:hypothetical protein n=1 Tax=Streptomyces sp. NBC_00555 TaxID=2903662 RepID=UPI00225006A5|nr:hypothetical protein [Streptomyces sp. NBC_00555]MCX5010468.1 hypothetical protein [Streptomyces sp. NBC_00555]